MKIGFFKTLPVSAHMQLCRHGKRLTTVSISVWQLHACSQTERPAEGKVRCLDFRDLLCCPKSILLSESNLRSHDGIKDRVNKNNLMNFLTDRFTNPK